MGGCEKSFFALRAVALRAQHGSICNVLSPQGFAKKPPIVIPERVFVVTVNRLVTVERNLFIELLMSC